ncbi:LysR substrate-binding domain-containing protein [Ferrimonas sp. SCSIO 43195]|uniref:LysR substrate-binding domain-containing protein n=1 Tax=Ferrimonas sp. SCSIO 43195 TaxID=2822844 RepID=UPI0020760334|nr:LysR substrate-binding domain-containing protein [Ferrimonas sp. SCSIO 43195]USD35806.1 LysR family transcriptional regulator [Ferrimonas sp. SCSIO 43195]
MYRPHSTLEQWRILQAVVDYGGYAHAAAALNKSQSSLNHAVAKLQQQLGVQLLRVKGRKAELTDEGKVLLRRSRQLTQQIEQLEQLANNMEQGWEHELIISRESIYPSQYLFDALSRFYPESRGTRVTVIDNIISGSSDAISSRSADLVITGHVPPGHLGTPLAMIKMILCCHPNHPLTREQEVDSGRLERELQIVIRDTGTAARDSDKDVGWLKAKERWTVSHFFDAIDILKQGVGFCWIPDHMVAEALTNGDLVSLHSSVEKHLIPLTLVIPNPDNLGPAGKRFAEILQQCSPLTSSHPIVGTPVSARGPDFGP